MLKYAKVSQGFDVLTYFFFLVLTYINKNFLEQSQIVNFWFLHNITCVL